MLYSIGSEQCAVSKYVLYRTSYSVTLLTYGIASTPFFTDCGFYKERTEVHKPLPDLHIKVMQENESRL